jgi:hypothetical protein
VSARKNTKQTPNESCAAYKIEKDIPIASTRNKRPRKYPICEMQLGDSFLIPEKEIRGKMSACVHTAARYYKYKVTTRKVDDGIRVWRVA